MRRAFACVLVMLLITTPLVAAELIPFMERGRLGVTLRDLRFPDTLRKDLASGLTNRILIRIVAHAQSRPVAQKGVEMTARYDLWDETFRYTLLIDGAVIAEQTFSSLDEMVRLLANPQLPRLFSQAELPAGETLTLNAQCLLNPIDRERMDKIRKWVAENSASPGGPAGVGSSAPLGASTSNAIFNTIFEQYASGKDMSSAWNTTVVSKPFRPTGIPRDGK